MAFINITDASSIVTEAMTIFNGSLDERYINLQAIRKDLSKAVTKFVVERKALMAMNPEELSDDMEVEERLINVDQERVFLAMNVNAWVHTE